MRVSDVTGAYEVNNISAGSRWERAKKTEKSKDTLAISDTAKDYQAVSKALAAVSDIRNEKVDFIKSQIESNSYKIKAGDVANKLLSNLVV